MPNTIVARGIAIDREIDMTISSLSGSTPQPPPQPDPAFRQAFQQLTSAIGSGDTKTAQSAYATLQQLVQQSGKANSNDPMGKFLAAIGNDLQKGDITTAQSDLTSFQQARAAHHPHADNDGDAAGGGTLTKLGQSSSSNIVDVSA